MSNEVEQIINKLFNELSGIFPAWKSAFKTQEQVNEAKRQWLKAFMESELNRWEWIEKGLSVARLEKSPFLPSVGQFMDWCRYEDPLKNIRGLGKQQFIECIEQRKKEGLPCAEYDSVLLEDLKED